MPEVGSKGQKMLKQIIIFAIFISVAVCDRIPVLIWSPSRSLTDLPQNYVGSAISTDSFGNNYLSPLTSDPKHSLVVFQQDKLSLDDFTKYADVYNPSSDGGSFKNVKSLMDDNYSVHLPAVKLPIDAIADLKKSCAVHHISNPSDIEGLQLQEGKVNLIIVTLTSVHGRNEEKALAENDQQIADTLHQINKREIQYSALYTGAASAKASLESGYAGRHLLAEDVQLDAADKTNIIDRSGKNGSFSNISLSASVPGARACIYMFLRSINLTVSKYVETKLVSENVSLSAITEMDTPSGSCTNTTAMLEMTFKPVDKPNITITSATIHFEFEAINKWDWSLSQMSVKLAATAPSGEPDFTGETVMWNKNVTVSGRAPNPLRIPRQFSYHCSDLKLVNLTNRQDSDLNLTAGDNKIVLRLDGFQLELWPKSDTAFQDGWDCVEFFTPGIWMGIFSVGILTIILLAGLSMIADLKTMDRFDDPKGKTISVNVNE